MQGLSARKEIAKHGIILVDSFRHVNRDGQLRANMTEDGVYKGEANSKEQAAREKKEVALVLTSINNHCEDRQRSVKSRDSKLMPDTWYLGP